jgi:hypothetical protein
MINVMCGIDSNYALTGLDVFLPLFPGRCPGLSHCAPSGRKMCWVGSAPTGSHTVPAISCAHAANRSSEAPTGRHVIAQGNALGTEIINPLFSSPVRA